MALKDRVTGRLVCPISCDILWTALIFFHSKSQPRDASLLQFVASTTSPLPLLFDMLLFLCYIHFTVSPQPLTFRQTHYTANPAGNQSYFNKLVNCSQSHPSSLLPSSHHLTPLSCLQLPYFCCPSLSLMSQIILDIKQTPQMEQLCWLKQHHVFFLFSLHFIMLLWCIDN